MNPKQNLFAALCEIVGLWVSALVKIERLEGILREVQDHLFNVGVDEYIIARETGVRTNHSCDANAGITRDVFLVAMRDIERDDDWTLECLCGSPSCRKLIGNYRDFPDDIKRKYEKYSPDWIKRT